MPPALQKGCFCCGLATCVRVQAYVLTSFFLLIAVLDAVFLATWVIPREQHPGPHVDEFGMRFISNTKVFCIVLLACLLVWVALGLLLLYGIHKRSRILFWPYMVVGSTNLFITTGLLIFYASSVHAQIPNVIVLVLILALQFYLLLHVVSLYQKIREEDRAIYEGQ